MADHPAEGWASPDADPLADVLDHVAAIKAESDANRWWRAHGYLAGRRLAAPGLWLIVAPMVTTYRVMVATEQAPTGEFYCYREFGRAIDAFHAWDGGTTNPIDGWTKHHRSDGTAEWPSGEDDGAKLTP